MLQTSRKKCVGCAACSYICPQKCIEMKEDKEHFISPTVNIKKCINCDLCNKICPINYKKIENFEKKCYIAQLKDKNILKECASGGAFYGISQLILNNGGAVFGVCYVKNQLKYIKVTKKKELILLTKSKYFQCELTPENYTELIEESNKNTILVSGTPCQISAMKNIPKLNKENTIFLEILCQGVPNDFVIKKYDSEKEKKFNKKIVNHIFRAKDKYVGKNYLNKYVFNDGSLKYYIGEEDPLSLTFQRQMFLRESCYKCEYSQEKRVADFTVGDYWEDDIKNKNIVLKDGVSIILCNTEKAQKFLEFIDIFNVEEKNYKDALKNNIPFHKSVKRPFARNYSYKLLELGLKPSIVAKIICYKYYLKRIIKKLR